MPKNKRLLQLSGFEAHIILSAFDEFYKTDIKGKVGCFVAGPATQLSRQDLQAIRDKLFYAHSHEPDRSEK